MVDNFNVISSILIPKEQNTYFYHLQVIRRGKDHSKLPAANRVIKAYFVTSAEYLNKHKEEIVNLCKLFGARAYINLAKKSVEVLGKRALFNLSERIYTGDYKHIWKVFNTAAGKIKGTEPRWVVDVDDPEIVDDVKLYIDQNCFPDGSKVLYVIPTKSGYHLITTSFNIKQFEEQYPDVKVHKNNPTLLYA